jgi:hypothetical protein
MRSLHFEVERSIIGNVASAALLLEGESTLEALQIAMWDAVRLEIQITIEDVTMPATMWEDPEHWAEDWATKLGVPLDEAPDAVAALLAGAITDDAEATGSGS